jgi:hypothetical protein
VLWTVEKGFHSSAMYYLQQRTQNVMCFSKRQTLSLSLSLSHHNPGGWVADFSPQEHGFNPRRVHVGSARDEFCQFSRYLHAYDHKPGQLSQYICTVEWSMLFYVRVLLLPVLVVHDTVCPITCICVCGIYSGTNTTHRFLSQLFSNC